MLHRVQPSKTSVKEGDRVKKGQLLVEWMRRAREAKPRSALAQVKTAEADMTAY